MGLRGEGERAPGGNADMADDEKQKLYSSPACQPLQ